MNACNVEDDILLKEYMSCSIQGSGRNRSKIINSQWLFDVYLPQSITNGRYEMRNAMPKETIQSSDVLQFDL